MFVANDIIESAQKAHSALEEELNINSLRCSFLYWSHNAYITNKSVDESISKLMILVGSIFMAIGGGGTYVFSKIYPNETELAFFTIITLVVAFYYYKKKKLVGSCKQVTLSDRPVWFYLRSLSGHIPWGTAIKLAMGELILFTAGTLGLIAVFINGYYMLSLLLLVVMTFISAILIGLAIVFYNKLSGKIVLTK